MQAIRPRRVAVGLGAALALISIAGPAVASAAPTLEPTLSTLTGKPRHLALGADGNVWTPLSDSGVGNDIARIAPDGTVTEFDVDTLSGGEGIVSDGTNLWVTKFGNVVKFSPANPAGAVATPIAAITDARAITVGSDGNLWTGSGDKVVHFAPANPAGFTSTTIAGMSARGIAAGGDGALYIADFGGQGVRRVTTAGVATLIPLGGGPQEVATGPGTQVAVANPGAVPQVVARVDNSALLGNVPMPLADPFGIVLANDGAYWTARFAGGDVGRIAPDGTVTALPIAANSGPRNITKGPGDTLFVGLETAMKVARISGVSAPAPVPPVPTPTPTPTPTPQPAPRPLLAVHGLRVSSHGRITVTVNTAAQLRFKVRRLVAGRRVGSSCVRPTSKNASARRCARELGVGLGFTVRAKKAGTVHVKVPRSIPLRPGTRYRVILEAVDGARSLVVQTLFTAR